MQTQFLVPLVTMLLAGPRSPTAVTGAQKVNYYKIQSKKRRTLDAKARALVTEKPKVGSDKPPTVEDLRAFSILGGQKKFNSRHSTAKGLAMIREWKRTWTTPAQQRLARIWADSTLELGPGYFNALPSIDVLVMASELFGNVVLKGNRTRGPEDNLRHLREADLKELGLSDSVKLTDKVLKALQKIRVIGTLKATDQSWVDDEETNSKVQLAQLEKEFGPDYAKSVYKIYHSQKVNVGLVENYGRRFVAVAPALEGGARIENKDGTLSETGKAFADGLEKAEPGNPEAARGIYDLGERRLRAKLMQELGVSTIEELNAIRRERISFAAVANVDLRRPKGAVREALYQGAEAIGEASDGLVDNKKTKQALGKKKVLDLQGSQDHIDAFTVGENMMQVFQRLFNLELAAKQ